MEDLKLNSSQLRNLEAALEEYSDWLKCTYCSKSLLDTSQVYWTGCGHLLCSEDCGITQLRELEYCQKCLMRYKRKEVRRDPQSTSMLQYFKQIHQGMQELSDLITENNNDDNDDRLDSHSQESEDETIIQSSSDSHSIRKQREDSSSRLVSASSSKSGSSDDVSTVPDALITRSNSESEMGSISQNRDQMGDSEMRMDHRFRIENEESDEPSPLPPNANQLSDDPDRTIDFNNEDESDSDQQREPSVGLLSSDDSSQVGPGFSVFNSEEDSMDNLFAIGNRPTPGLSQSSSKTRSQLRSFRDILNDSEQDESDKDQSLQSTSQIIHRGHQIGKEDDQHDDEDDNDNEDENEMEEESKDDMTLREESNTSHPTIDDQNNNEEERKYSEYAKESSSLSVSRSSHPPSLDNSNSNDTSNNDESNRNMRSVKYICLTGKKRGESHSIAARMKSLFPGLTVTSKWLKDEVDIHVSCDVQSPMMHSSLEMTSDSFPALKPKILGSIALNTPVVCFGFIQEILSLLEKKNENHYSSSEESGNNKLVFWDERNGKMIVSEMMIEKYHLNYQRLEKGVFIGYKVILTSSVDDLQLNVPLNAAGALIRYFDENNDMSDDDSDEDSDEDSDDDDESEIEKILLVSMKTSEESGKRYLSQYGKKSGLDIREISVVNSDWVMHSLMSFLTEEDDAEEHKDWKQQPAITQPIDFNHPDYLVV